MSLALSSLIVPFSMTMSAVRDSLVVPAFAFALVSSEIWARRDSCVALASPNDFVNFAFDFLWSSFSAAASVAVLATFASSRATLPSSSPTCSDASSTLASSRRFSFCAVRVASSSAVLSLSLARDSSVLAFWVFFFSFASFFSVSLSSLASSCMSALLLAAETAASVAARPASAVRASSLSRAAFSRAFITAACWRAAARSAWSCELRATSARCSFSSVSNRVFQKASAD
mmetsp:Transcript_19956/g.59693  ORF Transcript_19956/g.59693 Transcript_19956/m.59693 type:complete len:231 (-) Transcript_19956:880-1572(-)